MSAILQIKGTFFNPWKDKLRGLFHKIGVDRAVSWGILARLWSIAAGPVSLLFIASRFSAQLQGYYYTFYSIIAFQFLLELGLGNIIIQFASHEWSKLSLDDSGVIVGEIAALSRLQSLMRLFFRWFCITSAILTLALGVAGFLFFTKNRTEDINWVWPWLFLCILNGVAFFLIPAWSILEGCNQVLKLYSYRFVQGLFSSLALWIAILSGAKLWAAPISSAVILICSAIFLKYKYGNFFKTLLVSKIAGPRIKWRQEILPLQWRLTIEVLFGPFAYTMFVPVLFKYYGPVIAGQMGMTLSLTSILFSVASAWLSPKVPRFGMLIAQKDYKKLDELFWHTTKLVIAVALAGALIAFFMVYILNLVKNPLATRFLPVLPSGLFLLTQVILIVSLPFSTYIRAHKKEPFLFVGVGGGISVGLSTLILGKYFSAMGMALGYLLIHLILVPIVIVIWYRCRKQWHQDESAIEPAIDHGIASGEDFMLTKADIPNV